MGSELAPATSVSGSMMNLLKVVAGALPQMKDGASAPAPVSRVTYIGKGEGEGYGVESGSKGRGRRGRVGGGGERKGRGKEERKGESRRWWRE